jgi:hypothetical protein
MRPLPRYRFFFIFATSALIAHSAEVWQIDAPQEWQAAQFRVEGIELRDGLAALIDGTGVYESAVKHFPEKIAAQSIRFEQSPVWLNWRPVAKVLPPELGDAPVFLSLGPGDYWAFGLKRGSNEDGYHAWHSENMQKWTHHGTVTPRRAKWTTTAEYKEGSFYIYYDFPNDQDPHVYVDDDLLDGQPGRDMGLAFKDPSDGSDCAVIRSIDGEFHLIYEDWSPINASKHSWDSPLAGHAVSEDGLTDFEILPPAVDARTEPTGVFKAYPHPHWHKDDPENYPGKASPVDVPEHRIKAGDIAAFAEYEVHEPEQDAFGDWAAISIGGRYYLFGDYHPAGTSKWSEMSVAWFTAPDIGERFAFCGHIGSGHPDPDIGFAEGQFYLLTQTKNDFVSPGPWVERVEARVGVDTSGDGTINHWSAWKEVKETYEHTPGFAKQIHRQPASLDLSHLPKGYGFAFAFKLTDTTNNASKPLIDQVTVNFE